MNSEASRRRTAGGRYGQSETG